MQDLFEILRNQIELTTHVLNQVHHVRDKPAVAAVTFVSEESFPSPLRYRNRQRPSVRKADQIRDMYGVHVMLLRAQNGGRVDGLGTDMTRHSIEEHFNGIVPNSVDLENAMKLKF